MKDNIYRRTVYVTALSWSLGLTAPANAQTAPTAAAGTDVTEIIVTARRIEERAQDVPISMTIFTQRELSKLNVVNASDLAAYTPSLSVNSGFGSQNTTFAIRGFVQDAGTAPSVGVYFADVVAPRGAATLLAVGDGAGPGTFFDLQNVQVLKGPQGTLFGRNTTGGDILVVPQKPTANEEGYIEASYGNYGMTRIQAVGNMPLNDAMRLRVGVDHEERAGYINNDSGVGPARLGDVDYTAVRASLVVDVTSNIETYTILSYVDSHNHGELQKLAGCSPVPTLINLVGVPPICAQIAQEQAKGAGFYTVPSVLTNPSTYQTTWQAINTTTWQASDTLTVKNIASYAQLEENLNTALFGTDWYVKGDLVEFAQVSPVQGGSSAHQSTATEEIRLQGRAANDRLDWQTGAYLEDAEPLGLSGAQSPVLLSCTNSANYNCLNPTGFGYFDYNHTKNYFFDAGVYEQTSYSLTDTLKLTEGLRNTWDRTHVNTVVQNIGVPTPGVTTLGTAVLLPCTNPQLSPPCNVDYQETSHAPTWLLGLDYKPTDNLLAYGKYARGYRAGGTEAQAPTGFNTFQPEKVDTYEIGTKTSFGGALKGTFNVAAFYNNFRNQQLTLVFDPKPGLALDPTNGIINVGKSRISGVEVDASISPLEGFRLDAGYTYLDARILQTRSVQTPADSPFQAVSVAQAGDTVILTPRSKATITGTYTLPLADSIGRVSVGATLTHTSKELSNYGDLAAVGIPSIQDLAILPALNLLNLNFAWNSIAGSPVDLSMFATNVTNRQYYTIVEGLYSPSFIGGDFAALGQPRMYGLRVRMRFGK